MITSLNEKTINFLENTCIFCQPWWLQAVSPDRWDVAVVERGGEVAAVLPYAYKTRLLKYRLVEYPPHLCFYLGPWLRRSEAKYVHRIEEQKELLTELIQELPPFASFEQWFHPSFQNWLPFYWRGFGQTTRYTYIIDNAHNSEEIWDAFSGRARTEIRKAQKHLVVVEDDTPQRFLPFLRQMYQCQRQPLPFSEKAFLSLDRECVKRSARKILFAIGTDGRLHAANYIVEDASTVYALLRVSNPDLRGSGASSFIMWKSIEHAVSHRKKFDFAGSWHPTIEKFVRSFGGHLTPFFEIRKSNSPLVRSYRFLHSLFRPVDRKPERESTHVSD